MKTEAVEEEGSTIEDVVGLGERNFETTPKLKTNGTIIKTANKATIPNNFFLPIFSTLHT
jgi:hypothetical protein